MFMVVLTLLVVSVFLQVVAVCLALRLAHLSGWRAVWLLLAGIIALMTIRRGMTLVGIFSGDVSQSSDLVAEGIALAISILLVAGLVRFDPVFRTWQRAETALREGDRRYNTLFEQSAVGVAQIDSRTGRFVRINQRYCDMVGYARDEMLGMDFQSITHPDDLQADLDNMARLRAGELGTFQMEKRYFRKDGAVIWARLTVLPLWAKNAAPDFHLAVIEDITERKRAEEALKEREDVLRLFVEHSPAALAMFDREMRYVSASRRWLIDFGLGDRELTGRSHYEVFPEIPERWKAVHQRCLAGAVERMDEDSFVRGDGHTEWVRWEIRPWKQADGEIGGIIMFVEVLTDRKRAEAALRENEERLRQIIRVSDIGIFDHDHLAGTIYWSPMQRTIFGWGPDEPVTLQGFLATVHPEDSERITAAVRRAHDPSGDGLYDVEHRIIRRDGAVRWLSARGQTFFEGEGGARRPARTVGANIDITDRKQAEKAVRESEKRYRNVIELSPEAVLINHNGRIVFANQACLRLLGAQTADQLLGKSSLEIVHPDEREEVRGLIRGLLEGRGQMPLTERKWVRLDGSVVDVEVTASTLPFEDGTATQVLARDVTERKRVEEAVRESEAFINSVLEHLPNMVFVKDARELKFVRFNKAGEELLGYPREAMLGKSDYDFFPKEQADSFTVKDREVLHSGRLTDIPEEPVRTKDKGMRILHTKKIPIADETGAPRYLLGISEDITERKRAEEALQASEERFRASFKNAAVGIGLVDRSGRFVETNQALSKITGYSEEELKRLTFTDITHPDDRTDNIALYQKMTQEKREGFVMEKRYVRKDGAIVWITLSMGMICDRQGNVTHTIGLIEDITKRKLAEEALRESGRFNQQIIASAREGIIVYDRDGRYVVWNPFMEELTGLRTAKVLGKRPTDLPALYHAEHGKLVMEHETMVRIEAAVTRAMTGETFTYLEIPFVIRQTGMSGWTSVRYGPFRNAQGDIVGVIATVWEITELKRVEEALRASEERLGQAIRVSDIGIFDHDHRADTIYWSPRQRKIYGWGPDEPVTLQGFLSRVHPGDLERIAAAVRRAHDPAGDGAFDVEHRTVWRTGEVRWVATRSQTFFEGEGGARRPVRTVGAVIDITERKQADEALREHAARLQMLSRQLVETQEAEGRRIGRELHDDLGQILTSLKIYLQTLPARSGSSSIRKQKADSLALVDQAVERIRNLSADLHPTVLDDLGLTAALRWMLDRRAKEAGFKTRFVSRGMEERLPPEIETTIFRIAQEAFTNIVRHARAQNVRIELSRRMDEVHLRVSDDGIGFDPQAARAEAMRGKSLGLIGMEERALLVKGRFEIRSARKEGTELHVYIPLVPAALRQPGADQSVST
jgi:PAS domain S-box-containing protein